MKKYLLPLVLLGLFLIAVPGMADEYDVTVVGDSTSVFNDGINDVAEGAVIINAADSTTPVILSADSTVTTPLPGWNMQSLATGGGHTYNITGFNVTGSTTATPAAIHVIAIATNDDTGTHNIGNVFITAATTATDNSILTGFAYQSDTEFAAAGRINFGTTSNRHDLTVIQTGAGAAFGFTFVKTDGTAQEYGGQTVVGTINVNGGNATTPTEAKARGWYSGAVTNTGVIDIANIDIFAGTSAIGIFVEGDFEGELQVGTITVKGKEGNEGDTNSGIQVMGDWNSSIQSSVGSIVASANTQNIVHGVVIVGDDPPSGITGKFSGNLEIGSILAKNTGTPTNALHPAAAYGWASGTIETGAELKIDRITALSDTVAVGFGVNGEIIDGKIDLGNIIAAGAEYKEGDSKAAYAAVGFNANSGITGGTIEIGTITVRGNINAAGVGIGDLQAEIVADKPKTMTGGKITVAGMDVSTTGGDAQGWYSGAVSNGATLDLGTIAVTATGGGAAGIHIDGHFAGTLKTETITVRALSANNRTVSGIHIDGKFETEEESAIGIIDVIGMTSDNVYGIAVTGTDSANDGGEFTVSNNITAINNGAGKAIGIHAAEDADNTWINFSDNVTIIAKETAIDAVNCVDIMVAAGKTLNAQTSASSGADGAIYSGNSISVTLEAGAKVNVGSIVADATGSGEKPGITIDLASNAVLNATNTSSGTKVSVDGEGTANLGKIEVEEKLDVKGSSHVVISHESETGSGTVGKNAVLEITGNFRDATDIKLNDVKGNLVGGTFTDLELIDGVVYGKQAAQAKLSDGFLAALGMHNRYAAWNGVRDQMISGSGRSSVYASRRYTQTYRGQAGCACYACTPAYALDPCAPVVSDPCAPRGVYPAQNRNGGNTAWVNYTGRSDDYGSSFAANGNWELSTDGVQAGTDLMRNRTAQFGVLFGYEKGRMTNTVDRINAEDTYVGLYAARVLRNGADIRGVYAFGWQDYKMSRFQTGNYYTSSFKGYTSSAHLELGKRLSPGPSSLRPVIAVDVLHNKLNGAVESGAGNDAVRYGKTDLTQVFLRAGTEFLYNMHFVTLKSGIYYSYDLNGAVPSTRAELVTDPTMGAPLAGTKPGRSLLTFNTGGTCQLTDNFSLIGGYQGEYVFDRSGSKLQSTAYVGGAWQW